MNQWLDKQIEEVLENHPNFSVKESEGSFTLSGIFIMNAEYNNVPLYDEYKIEIAVSKCFPEEIPLVRELEKNVPPDFGHIYDNGALCV